MTSNTINIINVSSDLGSIYAGKSQAPTAFKTAGLQEKLGTAGWQVTESTALPGGSGIWQPSTRELHGVRNEAAVVEACNQVRKAVAAALANKPGTNQTLPFQLVLSGECLYCPAILSAYWRRLEGTDKRIGIIYVDADCDLATPTEPGSTGNIAGMTLTHLTLRDGGLKAWKPSLVPMALVSLIAAISFSSASMLTHQSPHDSIWDTSLTMVSGFSPLRECMVHQWKKQKRL